MAYTNVQNSGKLRTSSGAGLSWTPGAAPTVNNLLTHRVWGWSGSAFSAGASDAKDSSGTPKTFTQDRNGTNQSSMDASIYSLLVPSGLTTPLKNTNTATTLEGIFDEWSGNATTTIPDTGNVNSSASGVTSATSGTINTGANAGLVLAVIALDPPSGASGIATTGTSFTGNAVEQDNSTWQAGSADSRTATVASQTGLQDSWTWTGGAAHYTACLQSYNLSAGVSQDTPELYGRPEGLRGQSQMHQLLAQ